MKLTDLLDMSAGETIEWLIANAHAFTLQTAPVKVDSPEDIGIVGEEILVWDGTEWTVDYVECCADTGAYYMANHTDVEAYMPLPDKLN